MHPKPYSAYLRGTIGFRGTLNPLDLEPLKSEARRLLVLLTLYDKDQGLGFRVST